MPSLPDDVRYALACAGREFLKNVLNAVSDAAENAADRIDDPGRYRPRTASQAGPDGHAWTMMTAGDLQEGWLIRSGDQALRVMEAYRDTPEPGAVGFFGIPKMPSVDLHLLDEETGERTTCSLSAATRVLVVPKVPDDVSAIGGA